MRIVFFMCSLFLAVNAIAENISSNFALTSVSRKIFTPDDPDLSRSRIRFTVENPDFLEVTSSIFALDGRTIKTKLQREDENIFYWDGRDSENGIVASGVYLYQFETDGRVINGAIVVAR